MKELSMQKKQKVVRLFFSGLSYDQISLKAGIAKGSVYNIIEEFREGLIPLPYDNEEYLDTLRKLAVDILNNDTSVTQLKSYTGLHKQLTEMGVSNEKACKLLAMCQQISSPGASTQQFVSAGLELAEMEAEAGLGYHELIKDYTSTKDELNRISVKLAQLKQDYKEKNAKALEELTAIKDTIDSANEAFKAQKKGQKEQLDDYLKQNKLTWKKVKLASAMFSEVLISKGLSKAEKKGIKEELSDIGSLVVCRRQINEEVQELKAKEKTLGRYVDILGNNTKDHFQEHENLVAEIRGKNNVIFKLNIEVGKRSDYLASMNTAIKGHTNEISLTRAVMTFLTNTEEVSDYDFERFADRVIFTQQLRTGFDEKRIAVDGSGNSFYYCPIPLRSINLGDAKLDIDETRIRLAACLMPMVQDKFVPKDEHGTKIFMDSYLKMNKEINASKVSLYSINLQHPYYNC